MNHIMSIRNDPTKVYVETYGCQMNVADSELVGGILTRSGYTFTENLADAGVLLVNTCAIRENAEQRIYGRLGLLNSHRKHNPDLVIGILGCMAERLRSRLVDEERLVDLVVGPDEYRKLPVLIENALAGEKGIAVRLSRVEAYDDIVPLRTDGVSAWMSVMRGCDKFCTFCVVPFTRGRERSRPLRSIVEEATVLAGQGYRELTLLGQNVNSYRDGERDFADLMRSVAAVDSTMRIRFTTSHPQDMSDRLIDVIGATPNICKYVHLPVQSGSDRILRLMNRTYTVDHYRRLVEKLRLAVPGVSLSTDIISGFPTETVEDHERTRALMSEMRFDGAYTFKYSPRENTRAYAMPDDIPDEEKGRRVSEITTLQHAIAQEINAGMIDRAEVVLVEGRSKQGDRDVTGRTRSNKIVNVEGDLSLVGKLVPVHITKAYPHSLRGEILSSESPVLRRAGSA